MITQERKDELKALGYYIEDMSADYGEDWTGQYRWMHKHSDAFQDGRTSDSEDEAWSACDAYTKETA